MSQQVILLPLDGSWVAESALPYAQTLCSLLHTDLCLLRAVAPSEDASWGLTATMRARLEDQSCRAAEGYLDEIRRRSSGPGLSTTARVLLGAPADCILEASEAAEVGFVVMATHSRGGVSRMLLGSVADTVMRHCMRPTLLVRPGGPAAQRTPGVLRRIMLPLDGSELAEQALPLAQELTRAAGATLVLVRTQRNLSQQSGSEAPPVGYGRPEDEVTEGIKVYLGAVRKGLAPSLKVELVALRGLAAPILEDVELHGDIDLVVMATHGYRGLQRLVAGSIADRMVHLGVPTLLVRSVPAAGKSSTVCAVGVTSST